MAVLAHDVSLALLGDAHRDAVYALANDVHISPTSSVPYPCPLEVVTGWIADNQNAQGQQRHFAICYQGEVAGVAILRKIDRAAGEAELTYWVGYPFWGLGIGQRAAQLTAHHAFSQMGLQRLNAHCLKRGNPASRKILEHAGFVPDTQRADMPVEERFATMFAGDHWAFYVLSHQDFFSGKQL